MFYEAINLPLKMYQQVQALKLDNSTFTITMDFDRNMLYGKV